MSRIPMQALDSTGAHSVAAENRQEEVIASGTTVAGYIGKQILGSARGAARNVASERTWPGQVFLVHLVCLVCGGRGRETRDKLDWRDGVSVSGLYVVGLVGRIGKLTKGTKETRETNLEWWWE